jgi:nicotinamidase-related amidase
VSTRLSPSSGLDPARTALLVMDYQAGLVARLPDADALIERVNVAISDVRSRGGQIGWVRVGFTDSEFDAIPPTAAMARAVTPDRRADMSADAPATQIDNRLSPQPEDIAVRKVRVGAFSTTDLSRQLQDRNVDTLLLAGISTSGVVLSTVRAAMDRDYQVVVLADACADPDPETHDFLTTRIYPRHTTVINAADLPTLWR